MLLIHAKTLLHPLWNFTEFFLFSIIFKWLNDIFCKWFIIKTKHFRLYLQIIKIIIENELIIFWHHASQCVTEEFTVTFANSFLWGIHFNPKSVRVLNHCYFAGIWNNRYYPMTSMVTTVNRSAAHDLLVAGDAEGYIRLFR